jgi:hypothetical protein
MREIVFALEFRGRAGPVRGSESKRQEDGTISYGSAGRVVFETIGRGWVAPAPRAGWVVGGVVWAITAGDGAFAGARGLITSNFTVSADGEVIDHHVTRLYVP